MYTKQRRILSLNVPGNDSANLFVVVVVVLSLPMQEQNKPQALWGNIVYTVAVNKLKWSDRSSPASLGNLDELRVCEASVTHET